METVTFTSHYKYLDEIIPQFFERVGVNFDINAGVVSAHGDKVWCSMRDWEGKGIPPFHGAAVYLLTHVAPYGSELRDGRNKNEEWVSPVDWVTNNYYRFQGVLNEIDEEKGIVHGNRYS